MLLHCPCCPAAKKRKRKGGAKGVRMCVGEIVYEKVTRYTCSIKFS